MKKILVYILFLAIASGILICGCVKPDAERPGAADEPIILEQGSTTRPDLFSNDNESPHNPNLAPIFPGSQKINPGEGSVDYRESYITRAPLDAVERFYTEFFMGDDPGNVEESETEINLNSITSRDNDGRRQTALWLNQEDGSNGGLKVLLKEYESQQAVQIILTNLDETPPGLNPVGMYLTQEEMDAWLDEYSRLQEEFGDIREEMESQAVDPPVADELPEDSADESTESGEGDE